MRKTKQERAEQLLSALTEFKELIGTENQVSLSSTMRKHKVCRCYYPFIKEVMVKRHITNPAVTKWNPQMANPSLSMAVSILTFAMENYNEHRTMRCSHIATRDLIAELKARGTKEIVF